MLELRKTKINEETISLEWIINGQVLPHKIIEGRSAVEAAQWQLAIKELEFCKASATESLNLLSTLSDDHGYLSDATDQRSNILLRAL